MKGIPALALLLALGALAAVAWWSPDREAESNATAAWAVNLRHYGVDAATMEREVTIPLEAALAALPGAGAIQSQTEYGKSTVVIRRASPRDRSLSHQAVAEAAWRVWTRLPPTAQRPEIQGDSSSASPWWVAAVRTDPRTLEKVVKPALEQVEGVARVEVAGQGTPEVLILLHETRAALGGLKPWDLGRILGSSDRVLGGGLGGRGDERWPLSLDGRAAGLEALKSLLVPLGSTPLALERIATVQEGTREPDALSRIDGEPILSVAVLGDGSRDEAQVSRALGAKVRELEAGGAMAFTVIHDQGEEIIQAWSQVQTATAVAVVLLSLVTFLLLPKRRPDRPWGGRARWMGVVAVPLSLWFSLALAKALLGNLDLAVLAGASAGLGAAVDAFLLMAEALASARNPVEARDRIRHHGGVITGGVATTLIVLLPLGYLDAQAPGLGRSALAMGLVNAVAWVGALGLYPALVLGFSVAPDLTPRAKAGRGGQRRRGRLFQTLARLAVPAPQRTWTRWLGHGLWVALGLGVILGSGVAPGQADDPHRLYLHVEFEPGARVASVDQRLGDWAREAKALPGVRHVQTTARRGSGSVIIRLDQAVPGLVDRLRALPLAGGWIFVPEDRGDTVTWTVRVSGDEHEVVRSIARDLAGALGNHPLVKEVVLNFKEGAPQVVLEPRRDRLLALGTGLAPAAETLRRVIHGPVTYKRTNAEGETDVRISTTDFRAHSPRSLMEIWIPGASGAVPAAQLFAARETTDLGRLVRVDQRRVAALSVRTAPMDAEAAWRALAPMLEDWPRPKGYAIRFDPEAREAGARVRSLVWWFLLAVLACLMVLAALAESSLQALRTGLILPGALSLPLLAWRLGGQMISLPLAAAFVAVSGTAVNQGVLVGDALHSGGPSPRTLRRVIPSLLATTLSTLGGAAPFLFIPSSGAQLVQSLTFVSFWGTLGSFLVSLGLLPALYRRSLT